MSNKDILSTAPLGQKSNYIFTYEKSLLFSIARKIKRDEIGIDDNALPFYGFDLWNAYELSWLNKQGKPIVALAEFIFPCDSKNIIESKSLKLYLNSFNNSFFNDKNQVKTIIENDLSNAVNDNVIVKIFDADDYNRVYFEKIDDICLDDLDITCNTYNINKNFLKIENNKNVEEILYSNLLKSNCLVTGQPDWGTIVISYSGLQIKHESLLKYIVSFRNHNEFHEQCVERIFMDILQICKPNKLTVYARYTRRGGLDINPIRSTEKITAPENKRTIRQ